MRRVVILGNAGSGKSTLAGRLAARIGAPAIHLDAVFWGPGWSELAIPEFRARVADLHAGDTWVSDGNYAAASFDLRLPRADAVVWLERPWPACALRVLRRAALGQFRAQERLAEDCREGLDRRLLERLRFVRGFETRNRPRIEAGLAELRPDLPIVRLRSDAEARAFIADPEAAISAASVRPPSR